MNVGNPTTLVEFDARRIDELMRLWRASFEAGVGVRDPHSLSELRDYFLAEVLPRNDVRVALQADELVGFTAASAESVAQLYVRVGFQRRAIGTQLVAWAKEHSTGSLWLYTFSRNLAARAFYEHNGFVAVANGFEPTWQLEDIKYYWVSGAHNAA